MIKTIFLDMDGVIVGFNHEVCTRFNLPHPPKIYDYFEDIRPQVNEICNIDFWVNLEWAENGKEILKLVEQTFSNIYLLTTPMPNPESYTGKILWVQKHLPRYTKRTIITQVPKKLFAGSTTVLIDDGDKNIDEFNKAGGRGILVPRPWNRAYNIPTMQQLRMILKG